jgi:hypothetical protein
LTLSFADVGRLANLIDRGFLLSTTRKIIIYRTAILPVVFYMGVKLGLSHKGKNVG